jgi:predicted nucleic acid-binding protein
MLATASAVSSAPRLPVVLDTNIVLDVFVFDDAAAKPLRAALEAGALDWQATLPMRVELVRVLDYPQIAPRLVFYQLLPADVLAAFDRHARIRPAAGKAPVTCRDPDDQMFIDLAVSVRGMLFSKDRAVTSMRNRLRALGVQTLKALPDPLLQAA